MRSGIRLASGKIGKAMLLGVATIAMVIPDSDMALSQSGTGSQAPSYTAIDLNPNGFDHSGAVGIAGGWVVGSGGGPSTGGKEHALLWHDTAASVVDLHQFAPQGFTNSGAGGVDATGDIVGSADNGPGPHAVWWHRTGTGFSGVDLHPPGFGGSVAQGISGGQQAGSGTPPAPQPFPPVHALLWTGSAGSVVDLHPSGFTYAYSEATGISGGQIVGFGGRTYYPYPEHALLWTGTAASVVDIHPSGFIGSRALGISGGQIVGWGADQTNNRHALVWPGSAAGVVDLTPSGFVRSEALGTNGTQQVGWGITGGHRHALVWSGSASKVLDLHQLLPSGFTDSEAGGIDSSGNIVGDANASDGSLHAFLWRGKPAPLIRDVPQWYQTGIPPFQVDAQGNAVPNNWGTAQLDDTKPFLSIAQAGCALTALTIVTNFWKGNRITPTPGNPKPGGALTPADMTHWPLYLPDQSGDVTWRDNILNNAGIGLVRVFPNYNNASSSNGFDVFPDPTQTLDNILRNGAPVILRILTDKGQTIHFVVVTGKAPNGDYFLNDPGWYPSMTLNNLSNTGWWKNHVKRGENPCIIPCSLSADNFFVYANIPITKKDPLTLKGLGVYSTAPVEFILTDPQGRQTGFDPVSNTSFHDIPVSDYATYLYEDERNTSTPVPPPMKALDMANQMDGQYTLNVIGTGSGAFTVYVIASDAAGNDITQTYAGTTAPGASSQFTFPGAVITFAAFGALLQINPPSQAFEVNSTFTLGAGSAGIDPLTQPVTLQLRGFLVTIPAGSFTQTPEGKFVFAGTINGIALQANLTPTGGSSYSLKIEGAGAPNLPSANPVQVRLAIGNNGGSVTVNASF